ncbi:MAG: cytochrome b/b6 domain-containing protein [Proteobacteria bacterium]|nr:cytochrome b/b6 domain-containing protein [Pseudomonadota bacterium]
MSEVLTRADCSTILVWDRGVRIFHWGLVAGIVVCGWTGFIAPRNWLNLHLAAGAAVTALVCFRLIWGSTGSTYARFRSFSPSLAAVRAHLAAIAAGRPQHHIGHNPAGALMIYGLLGLLVLLILTGVIALGGALKQGPLAFAVPFAVGWPAREVHEWLAWGLLLLIAGHLCGVVLETLVTRENIVRAMLTGRKRASPAACGNPAKAHPVLAATAFVAGAAGIAAGTIWLSDRPAAGVPGEKLDAAYARECGACHFAFPPSLASAQTWAAVMASLDNHFGENANLDPTQMARMLAWLTANSAERFDTLPANLFRQADPAEPRRITATPAWQRIHRAIPDSVFGSKQVGARGACEACHRDAASGRFDPQSISLPKELR